jgi:hypothetical protein
MDAFDSSDSSAEDDDAPSPKKALPDFTIRKSDEDSVASGDDSAGWETEEDRVMNSFLAQTEAEEALDDLSDDVPMTEVHEFMLISGEEGGDGTEGQADGAAEVAPISVEYKARRVALQTTNVKTLKAIAIMLKLSPHGKKQFLFNHICDSLELMKVSDDEFEYRHTLVVGAKVPTWVILTPKVVPLVDGIDMGTDASIGYFRPTNKENAVGRKRSNF